MTTITPDAVEALHAALSRSSSVDDFSSGAPAEVIKHLNDQGFTIARAEAEGIRHSAVADYLKDDKGLRPAMSEAELERELEGRSYPAPGDIRLLTMNDARRIAKKYRGV